MFTVPITKTKLCRQKTKVLFWTNEQSFGMLIQLVDLSCSQGGTFCDPYRGKFSAAITCVRKGCKCSTFEKYKEFFDGAIGRLGRVLPSYKPSDRISLALAVEAIKVDFSKDSQVAANVFLYLSKMSGDVSDYVKGPLTEIYNSEVSGDNQRSNKTDGQTEMDSQVSKSDFPSISLTSWLAPTPIHDMDESNRNTDELIKEDVKT